MKDLVNKLKKRVSIEKQKQINYSSDGGIMVEMATSLPIFLVLIFMIIELMMYSYANLSAQYVVSYVMRDFVTQQGNYIRDDGNGGRRLKEGTVISSTITGKAKELGLIAIQGGLIINNNCEANTMNADRNETVANKGKFNNVCLSNVSLFSACNMNNGNGGNCQNYNGDNIEIRDGDLYSLNWAFKFPMKSWFALLLGKDNSKSGSAPNNQSMDDGVTISASASARLEPR